MKIALSFDGKEIVEKAELALGQAKSATPSEFHSVLEISAQEVLNKKSHEYAGKLDGASLFISFGKPEEGHCDLILEMALDFLLGAFRRSVILKLPRKPLDEGFWQIVKYYKLELGHLSFYKREHDRLSKYFNGDYDEAKKVNFARDLVATYMDSYLYFDDPNGYHHAIIENRLSLINAYLFRAAVILEYGYSIVPDTSLFTPLCCKRTESIVNLEVAKTCGAVQLNQDFKKYMRKHSLEINTNNIINLIDLVLEDFQEKNPHWFRDAFESDPSWQIFYDNSIEHIQYARGLFVQSPWNAEYGLPEGHSLLKSGRQLPVALYLWSFNNEYGVRQDGNADAFVQTIQVNKKVRNFIRHNLELPLIGEGKWVSEVRLLRLVQSLTTHDVVHQFRARWLEKQSIDIAVPKLKVAIEFNGRQHYEPVGYFGGEEAHAALLERDRRKALACKANGWRLIVVRFDMPQEEIEKAIKETLLE